MNGPSLIVMCSKVLANGTLWVLWLSVLYNFFFAWNFPCLLNNGGYWLKKNASRVANPLLFRFTCCSYLKNGGIKTLITCLKQCLESLPGPAFMETYFSLTADHIGQWWARQFGVHHEKLQLREVTVDHQPRSESAVRLPQQQARYRRIR